MIYYFVCTALVYSVKTIFRVTILINYLGLLHLHPYSKKCIRCIVLPQMMKNMQIELEEKKNLRDVMI